MKLNFSKTQTMKLLPLLLHALFLFLCFVLLFSSPIKSISDYSSLVYKNCNNNNDPTFPTTLAYSETLSSLFQDLVAHSSQSSFFKTIVGDAETSISGLFQCRGDLSGEDCYNCVSALPQMANALCGQTAAARVQLEGCYVVYELDGAFDGTPGAQGQLGGDYKSCGGGSAGGGFEEVREAAFRAVEGGVVSGNGFYATEYESMRVVAQCEGDLGGCACGECVERAMEVAREECGWSVSAQIYLDECFLSYGYYHSEKRRDENRSGKTVAIVVGGGAALCLGFVVLLFMKSLAKKGDDY